MYTINENLKETTCPVHLLKEHFGETVQIHGSIYKIRKMRGFAFVLLRTREGIIQCVYGESAEFSLEELTEPVSFLLQKLFLRNGQKPVLNCI